MDISMTKMKFEFEKIQHIKNNTIQKYYKEKENIINLKYTKV